MIYQYQCVKCKAEVLISKMIQDSSKTEYCGVCKSELKRIYSSPTISTSDGVKR